MDLRGAVRCGGKIDALGLLHPKDPPKLFVEFLGSLTLTAAGEEAFGPRRVLSTEHQLIFTSSAEGTGFTVQFSAHRSDSSNLFMHSASGEWGESCVRNGRRMGLGFVTTRAWSTIPSKWDAENTVEEGRICSLRRGGLMVWRLRAM